jgi:hypothetical protein
VGVPVGPISQEKPRSQKRDLGHPLKVWRSQLIFGRASDALNLENAVPFWF